MYQTDTIAQQTDTLQSATHAHLVMSEGHGASSDFAGWNAEAAIHQAYAVINDSAAETVDLRTLVNVSADNISGGGYPGMPIPYQMRDDSLIASCIILTFLALTWIFASSWRYIKVWLQDFFVNRERPNLFVNPQDMVLRGSRFVSLLPSLMLAVLCIDFVGKYNPVLLLRYSPYTLLGAAIVLFILLLGGKNILRNLTDNLFFAPGQVRKWRDAYLLSSLIQSLLLVALTLVSVYHGLAPHNSLIALAVIFLIIKIPLIYKCYTIFFGGSARYLNTFLYFCALEIAPVLVAIQIIRQIIHFVSQG